MHNEMPRPKWKTAAIVVAVSLFALAVRWYYVVHADVMQPAYLPEARGDAVDYYRYAWNIFHHATFARNTPGSEIVTPDSFRDPGYPFFLAAIMMVSPEWPSFYALTLLVQALLSALTVTCVVLLLRRRGSTGALAVAGVCMALWPHSVAATSFLLSEVLSGFLAAAALLLWSLAARYRSPWLAAFAGLVVGLAALTNAVLIGLMLLLCLLAWLTGPRTRRRRWALAFTVIALAGPVAWAVRNTTLPAGESASSRAAMNLVQGSRPDYHTAYQLGLRGDPWGQEQLRSIDEQASAFDQGLGHGSSLLASRLLSSPLHYLQWYSSKPALLWQWDIRIGQGDIYVYPTRHSPYRIQSFFLGTWVIARAANGIAAVAALAGVVLILVRRRRIAPELAALSALLLYVTAAYTIFQAEPRYSTPFRSEEIAAASVACLSAAAYLRRHRATKAVSNLPKNDM